MVRVRGRWRSKGEKALERMLVRVRGRRGETKREGGKGSIVGMRVEEC